MGVSETIFQEDNDRMRRCIDGHEIKKRGVYW